MSLTTPVSPGEVIARLRAQTRPPRLGRLRPGEEVAFLGPSGYSRARAVVRVEPDGDGARVVGTLRFGRLERASVLLAFVWFVLVGARMLVATLSGDGPLPFLVLVALCVAAPAATWARRRDRRRMRAYLETLLAPAPVVPAR